MEVVAVVLIVWKSPVVPKFAPADVAFTKIVLKETFWLVVVAVEIIANPRTALLVAVPLAAAGAIRFPTILLEMLLVAPEDEVATTTPSTEAVVPLLAIARSQIVFFVNALLVPPRNVAPTTETLAVAAVLLRLEIEF